MKSTENIFLVNLQNSGIIFQGFLEIRDGCVTGKMWSFKSNKRIKAPGFVQDPGCKTDSELNTPPVPAVGGGCSDKEGFKFN